VLQSYAFLLPPSKQQDINVRLVKLKLKVCVCLNGVKVCMLCGVKFYVYWNGQLLQHDSYP